MLSASCVSAGIASSSSTICPPRFVRGDVEANQGCIPDPGGVRGGQVVDDDDAITALAQEADDMGANVAGATTNENTHGLRIRRVGSSLLPASGLWYRSERA